jgi:hypothetical protein
MPLLGGYLRASLSRVKVFAAIALVAGALVLSTTSSSAGIPATAGGSHSIHFSPRTATRLAPAAHAKAKFGLDCVASCTAYESSINQYFTDIAADSAANATTNVYSVLPQYSVAPSSLLYSVAFDPVANVYVDTNPFPKTKTCQDGFDSYCVTDKQLQTEIGNAITAHGWPTQSTSTLYFIFTPANVGVCIRPGAPSDSNQCTTNVFCAYHYHTSNFIYAVEPDAGAVAQGACDTGQAPVGNGADATLNTVSHEQIEAITDPLGNGWFSNDVAHQQPEIGDLCAYDFGTPLGTPGTQYNQTINGHNYFLQLEYSNADAGCVPYLGGPVTAADPGNGVGPLVLQDPSGTVMNTNTVYAIYWIPAAPQNTHVPKIAGAATVGKRLKALSGAWSGDPDYTYRWRRCSAAGTTCKNISKATDSKYLLTAADAGHRIEVRVTATNPGGRVSATSIPTAKVRS